VAGFLAGQDFFSLPTLILGLLVSAVLGNVLGYEFGRRVGPKLFSREDSFIFKKSHVIKAHNFYDKHGPKAIVFARFMPIVRTFAPIVAGVANMNYRTFLVYNIFGAFLWTILLVILGYSLGSVINVDRYLLPIILVIIALSFVPGIVTYYTQRVTMKK
jgi:membrane-associated protein